MKINRYPFKDNLISTLIGAVIAIPICACAWTAQQDKKDVEIQVIAWEDIAENEALTSLDLPTGGESKILEEPVTEEWIDGGYNDRVSVGEFKVTAYCPCEICCPGTSDGITYTETIATAGRTLSVDPEVIPLGSIVEINGINYVAEDIGGGIHGNHVEIYFDNHEDALEWGVQNQEIFMVEEAINE